jgi:hypothetical protein
MGGIHAGLRGKEPFACEENTHIRLLMITRLGHPAHRRYRLKKLPCGGRYYFDVGLGEITPQPKHHID